MSTELSILNGFAAHLNGDTAADFETPGHFVTEGHGREAIAAAGLEDVEGLEIPPFGQSLHVDLYGVSSALCDDLSFCYKLLDDLTVYLGMHKQSPPYIFHSPDEQFPDKAGLSGWVPLIESGISIHTLTVKEFVTVDIYTCGYLNVARTIGYLLDKLGASTYESHHLVRGLKYHE